MYWLKIRMTTLPKVRMLPLVKILKAGKIAVIPTDTIYGIVGSALNPQTVERIYTLRKRAKDKPFIILISSLDDLDKFNIKLTKNQKVFLQNNWPNPLSVVLPCGDFEYLHRAKFSLAFRMPKNKNLLQILKQVGPLVAPSANIAGEKYAENINEAKKYFGNNVNYYINGGTIKSESSTLIRLEQNGKWNIIRQGKFHQ